MQPKGRVPLRRLQLMAIPFIEGPHKFMSDLDLLAKSYGTLFLRMHRLLDRRMAAGGASLAKTKMLMCVDQRGPMRAADIADYLGMAPRTVTEALDKLERDGLLVRSPDASDRRVKQITITGKGEQAIAATEPLRVELVDLIFGSLDAEQRASLATIIEQLSAKVDKVEGIDPD
ncbi:MarR family winged helix-turn-helix transcriptional regulator [Sphingomonas rustica]|uniref:MarR family winged helix-turn-helix transcriptional regulator n=1 Tax=Sphingomonas rustica TaxID=3103142 RepID=UPI0031FBC8F0